MSTIATADGATWTLDLRIEAWSADRTKIAYLGRLPTDPRSEFGVRVSNPDGSNNRLLVATHTTPFNVSRPTMQWSPDGAKIALIGFPAAGAQRSRVHVVSVATGAIMAISPDDRTALGTVAWAPDSATIAWTQIRPVAPFADQSDLRDVYVGNADGSGTPTRIIATQYFGAPSYAHGTEFNPPGRIDQLTFSPNGTRLAFIGFDFQGSSGTGSFQPDLWVANRDGSGLTQLSGDNVQGGVRRHQWPAWSPDGTRLAVGTTGSSNSPNGLSIVNASTGAFLRTISAGTLNGKPAWSDDGGYVAFSADRAELRFEDDVRVVNASTGAVQTVIRGGDTSLADDLVAWVPCLAAPPTCNGHPATHIGTNGPDTIRGTSGRDVIVSFGGNDIIKGRGGKDTICAGPGADRADGGKGNDTIFGGPGRDRLRGQKGKDKLRGGSGKDKLIGGSGNDNLKGGSGRDRLVGGSGNDVLNGGKHRDTCLPGTGNDTLRKCP